jgi:hypothetical protein
VVDVAGVPPPLAAELRPHRHELNPVVECEREAVSTLARPPARKRLSVAGESITPNHLRARILPIRLFISVR